jgi:hypothetical protein
MAFSKRWADASSEQAERQLFWNDFFSIFGVSLREVGAYEVFATRLSTGNRGWIDLLVPGEMAVEHKSAGEDLNKAMGQLVDYLDSLENAAMPRLLVACDFQNFYCQNLETMERTEFKLEELSRNIEVFWWLAGHGEHNAFEDEEEANLKATGYMAQIHDAMLASGYDAHALREWLTRILFCLFADDTEVWGRNAFTYYLFGHTKADGLDLGSAIAHLFQILNTPDDKRANNLDDDLAAFTYINGDLFAETLPIPSCDEATRTALLDACKFDWSAISPAIFGSMFQNVMTPVERRHLGAHYTTEENILKTIRPLFLDELEEELAAIKVTSSPQSRARIDAFHDKLAGLTFLDPACGCGNFLVIAYRELRRLETEVLRKRAESRGEQMDQVMDVSHVCKVTVGQFYGIELEEFPARIARTALYLMDHKENLSISKELGQYFARFPIPTSPHIVIGNALRMDWNDVLPATEADFVMGNPPFVGMSWMNEEQQADNRRVFSELDEPGSRTGRLDYVACWYAKSLTYGIDARTQFAFVSTNSITQGDQARALGPLLHSYGYHVDFAHRTFAWKSEARGTAHVHVVIIGFSRREAAGRKIFDYPDLNRSPVEIKSRNINWYLIDAPSVYPGKHTSPFMDGLPKATQGSKPWDGTNLLVEVADYEGVAADPVASRYLRTFRMGQEFVQGKDRWCLWLVNATPEDLRSSPVLRKRLEAVAEVRRRTKTASVQAQASTPYLFSQNRQPASRYLAMPKVSSSRRSFVPGAYLDADVIAGDKLIIFPDAPLWLFAILQSSMWNAWVRTVGGRLKSDIDLSVDLVYNAFPFPDLDDTAKTKLTNAAEAVLDARTAHPGASLADLYDPLAMPADLVKAHDELDRVVDSLFASRKTFRSDADRLAVLFERYEALTKVSADGEQE